MLWSANAQTVLVGKRTGMVELWDLRQSPTIGAGASCVIDNGNAVMDMELNTTRDTVLITCGRQVSY